MITRALLAALISASLVVAPSAASAKDQHQRFGTSVQKRALTVLTRGADPVGAEGVVDVLVVGSIHGNERAGHAVVAQLRAANVPVGQRWWLVASLNPDGARADTRQNARGVDLNRNFPSRWMGGGAPWDTYYPGPRVSSEPETSAAHALIKRIRPELTVWYHQHAHRVIRPKAARALATAKVYARASAMRVLPWPALRGTAVGWQQALDVDSAPLVVELPAGTLKPIAVRRHARAVVAAATSLT